MIREILDHGIRIRITSIISNGNTSSRPNYVAQVVASLSCHDFCEGVGGLIVFV